MQNSFHMQIPILNYESHKDKNTNVDVFQRNENEVTYIKDDRFFEGFDYMSGILPYDVFSCYEAAFSKKIPLRNELKSLVLRTSNGLYILSLAGNMYANFRTIKRTLGVKEACMTSDCELQLLGASKGSVNPMLKKMWELPQLLSEEIFELDYVSTNSGKFNEYVIFSPNEFMKHKEYKIGNFSTSLRTNISLL